MCELCSTESREQEIKRLRHYADAMRTLANQYDALADGRIKPHSDNAKNIGYGARNLIRELVESWV